MLVYTRLKPKIIFPLRPCASARNPSISLPETSSAGPWTIKAKILQMPITDEIKKTIMAQVTGSETRLSQQTLENIVRRQFKVDRKPIRLCIQELIAESALTYTYIYGTSYLELSFQRPVRISPSIVVKPYNIDFAAGNKDIVIDIFPGISFGSGAHPTTRLSVQGIEYVLREKQLIKNFSGSTVLDIGTGSGILAIAALKLGIETGIGVDTDACARAEAVKNTDINGYAHKIRIMDKSEIIDSVFSLVTANLRLPDIMTLYPFITQASNTNGIVVISGLRPFETEAVNKCYTQRHFTCLWRKEEKGWAGLVFAK